VNPTVLDVTAFFAIEGAITNKKQWAARRKIAYRLGKLEKKKTTRYQSLE